MKISPSQLKLYDRGCDRAWAYSRSRPRGAQTRAQALGGTVEAVLDEYLSTGKPPSLAVLEGKIALPGLQHLPKPGPENLLQHNIRSTGPADIEYVGRLDVWRPSDRLIVDHKTTSSIFQYSLSEAAFRTDFQRIIYADAVGGDCETRWVYYQTRPPHQALPRVREETANVVRALREEFVDPVALALRAIHDVPILEQRRNLNCCDTPYPCPYKQECYASDPPGTNMSIIDEIRAKAAARTAVQPAPSSKGADPGPGDTVVSGSIEPDSVVDSSGAELVLPKRGPGRPKGGKNKPKELMPNTADDVIEANMRAIVRAQLRTMLRLALEDLEDV